MIRNTWLAWALATLFAVLFVDEASAKQDWGVYVGVTVPVSRLDVSFDKTVDTTAANTLVAEPNRGKMLREKSSGDGWVYSAGFNAGFERELGASGVYLGGLAEVDFGGDEVEGQFDGVGASEGRNQLGELWPDQWAYERERSYGLAITLSTRPQALQSMNLKVYALGGLRWVEGSFTNQFYGCLSPTPCSPAADTPSFTPGIDERSLDFDGRTVGLGVEKAIREQFALRLESRYTSFEANRWVTPFDDLGVRVPAAVDADAWNLLLSLAWYVK